MANHFTLTTILGAGTWGSVTKPTLKESPEFTDQHMAVARRVCRVSRKVKAYGDQTPQENELTSNFIIEVRTTTPADLDNIVNQIRTILSLQTSLNRAVVANHEETGKRSRWIGMMNVITEEIDRRA